MTAIYDISTVLTQEELIRWAIIDVRRSMLINDKYVMPPVYEGEEDPDIVKAYFEKQDEADEREERARAEENLLLGQQLEILFTALERISQRTPDVERTPSEQDG